MLQYRGKTASFYCAHCCKSVALLFPYVTPSCRILANSISLQGKVMGTSGCYQKDGSHEYTNAFDGDLSTSFDYLEPNGGWAGLDLGTPRQIVYTPRSCDNYIRRGDEYELFYCAKKDKWVSLDAQLSGADSLAYKNVPTNVLLLLRNYSRGIQERIFTYEGGKQYWK